MPQTNLPASNQTPPPVGCALICFFVLTFILFIVLSLMYRFTSVFSPQPLLKYVLVFFTGVGVLGWLAYLPLCKAVKWEAVFFGATVLCFGLAWFGVHLYYRFYPVPQTSFSSNLSESERLIISEQLIYNNLDHYNPFMADSLTAVLPVAADFKIEDHLPRMDAALALYPVSTAFVKAVYPHDSFLDENGAALYRYSPSPQAYENLITGKTDILLAASPSAVQWELAAQANVQLCLTPVGKEAFVFFVNQENPLVELPSARIKDIYSGEIYDWQQLGGNPGRIRAYQRNPDSGSQTAFLRFMDGMPIILPIKDSPGMGAMVASVSSYRNAKNAIGFSFRFFVTSLATDNEVKLLAVDGIYPDINTIADDTYPLTSYFYAVTLAENQHPHLENFIRWMLSPQGQYLIAASGYVPIGSIELAEW